MDVRCERCKTDYELDDARVNEAGITVKCTTCGHVFKVKTNALGPTTAMRPEDAAGSEPIMPAGPTGREWMVRQPGGELFTIKELTTLQRWIVERKLTREAEISLTGESWKKLGAISELEPFFQVLDEASRAQVATPAPVAPVLPPERQTQTAYVGDGRGAARSMKALSAARHPSGGTGAGRWAILLLAATLLGVGGYLGYTQYWLPRQQPEQQRVGAQLEQERLAREKAEAEASALGDGGEGSPLAAAPPTDAGAPIAEPPVPPSAPAPAPAPVRDFDWYMAQGDRLREREKPEAALDAYGKAAELAPESAEPLAGRGWALLDLGQELQAEAAFLQALKVNPRYGVAMMGLGETYRAQGKSVEAVRYYEMYLEALPNGPEAPVARAAISRLKK